MHPRRVFYGCIAYGCAALAFVGVFVPLLPTTPFLLLAAWAAPKASPRLDAWLHAHPRFGPALKAWRDERAVPSRAKWAAFALMTVSWLVVLATAGSPWPPVLTGLLFVGVGAYLWSRPAPRAEARER